MSNKYVGVTLKNDDDDVFPRVSFLRNYTLQSMSKNSELTNKYLDHLHYSAIPSAQKFARELRSNATKAEEKQWALLRNRQVCGKKFRRQHPIANYVADFYCHESKLVIELDGNVHKEVNTREYNKERTAVLNEIGITVIRFWNAEVINHPEKVMEKIVGYLKD